MSDKDREAFEARFTEINTHISNGFQYSFAKYDGNGGYSQRGAMDAWIGWRESARNHYTFTVTEMRERHNEGKCGHNGFECLVCYGMNKAALNADKHDRYAPKLTEKEAVEAATTAIEITAVCERSPEKWAHPEITNPRACAVVAFKAAGVRFKEEA